MHAIEPARDAVELRECNYYAGLGKVFMNAVTVSRMFAIPPIFTVNFDRVFRQRRADVGRGLLRPAMICPADPGNSGSGGVASKSSYAPSENSMFAPTQTIEEKFSLGFQYR
jgi:hypothetical protein